MLSEGERAVLGLLAGERTLATADAWSDALGALLAPPQDDSTGALDANAASAIVAAAETIVPHLSDYKTFSENLSGLLELCEQECLVTLFNLLTRWLSSGMTASPAFRRWLYAYVNDATDTMMSVDPCKWRQAVLVAALRESDASLRAKLLRLIDQQIGSLAGVIEAKPLLSLPHSELSRLLAFYWNHAEKLSRSSTLCAAKVAAMAGGAVEPSEGILAFLRWGRALQPFFFENFVADMVRLQTLRRPAELELRVPSTVQTFIDTTAATRSIVMARLEASRLQLQNAEKRKVKHVYRTQDCSKTLWTAECDVRSTGNTVDEQVFAYLANDLALLPTEAFPSVFSGFAVLAACLLRHRNDKNYALDTDKLIVTNLFGLLSLRTDSSSLLLIVAAIIDLRIASLPIWREDPDVFTLVIDEISESIILEINVTKRWVLQATLHQLVLECDPSVLLFHSAFLRDKLPHETYDLACHRIPAQ